MELYKVIYRNDWHHYKRNMSGEIIPDERQTASIILTRERNVFLIWFRTNLIGTDKYILKAIPNTGEKRQWEAIQRAVEYSQDSIEELASMCNGKPFISD